jgi:hypothetical protein
MTARPRINRAAKLAPDHHWSNLTAENHMRNTSLSLCFLLWSGRFSGENFCARAFDIGSMLAGAAIAASPNSLQQEMNSEEVSAWPTPMMLLRRLFRLSRVSGIDRSQSYSPT